MGLRVGIDVVDFSEFGRFIVLFSSKITRLLEGARRRARAVIIVISFYVVFYKKMKNASCEYDRLNG